MIFPFPSVLSLSKDAYRLEAWFDKLTANYISSEVQHV